MKSSFSSVIWLGIVIVTFSTAKIPDLVLSGLSFLLPTVGVTLMVMTVVVATTTAKHGRVVLAQLRESYAQEHALRALPTPASTLPFLHNTLDVGVFHFARLYDWLLENSQLHEGKPWRFKVLGRPPTLVLGTVEAFEDVLKTQFDAFGKGTNLPLILKDVMGRGIIAADGHHWWHQRKTASRLFSLHMLHCDTGPTHFDLKRLTDRYTVDVFTKIGFGVELGGLVSGTDPFESFDRCSRVILHRFRVPMWFWQIKHTLGLGDERQHRRDVNSINTILADVISKSMAEKNDEPANEPDSQDGARVPLKGTPFGSKRVQPLKRDLVSLFLSTELRPDGTEKVGAHNKEHSNDDQSVEARATLLRDMTINFIAAGRDTTSQSICWFVIMMNRHPDTLQKLRDELDAKLPTLVLQGLDVPTLRDVEQLTYLDIAIHESMRLNPVVPLNSRTPTRDVTLYDGTFVKAGTHVILSSYVMHRLTNVWGEDATSFRPERWLDPQTGERIRVSPFKFAAFAGGPRQCIGMRFALMELQIVLALLFTRFELKTARDPWTYTYMAGITLTLQGELDVSVRKRPYQPQDV